MSAANVTTSDPATVTWGVVRTAVRILELSVNLHDDRLAEGFGPAGGWHVGARTAAPGAYRAARDER